MALVDPNIALSYRAPNIQPQNMMADYAAIQQIQSGQRQGELAQYQLGAAQRAEKTQNVLAGAYAQATDPATGAIDYNKLRTIVAGGGAGAQIPGIEKTRREMETAALTQQEAAFKVQKQKSDFVAQAKRDTSQNPSDANITAYKEDLVANPLFSEVEKKQMMAGADRLLSMPVEQRRAMMSSQGATAGDLATAESARLGRLTTERGQDITAATAKAGQAVTLRGQNLLDTREKENIAIRQEDQRRKGDPAFAEQMAAAKTTGEATAKDKLLAAKVLPKVLDTAEQTLSQIDSLIGQRDTKGNLVKGAAPHPGFEDVVGATWKPGLRFVPGTAAADFQSKFDQVKGGAFLQAFETLKGGGSITNVEGEKGTAALNRMSIATSEKEFVQAAREFQNIVRAGVQRAQAKVPGAAAAAPNATSDIDALLNKYK